MALSACGGDDGATDDPAATESDRDEAPDMVSSSGNPPASDNGVGGHSSVPGASGGANAAPAPTPDGPGLVVGSPADLAAADCRSEGDGLTTLVFVNGCTEAMSFRGSDISGGEIDPGGLACVDIGTDIDTLDAKRYWGFLKEDPGPEHHTLAEFTFNTDFNEFDWYNISHVDAHNLPMQIVPLDRPDCETLTCRESWLSTCPDVGQELDDDGNVIACVSPERDNADSTVARFFEACDDAYAWSGDDQRGDDPSPVRACAGEDWGVVFCPE